MANVEIINTGSELMLGFVLNTHQQWLCRQLSDAGYVVHRQMAVPDTGIAIQQAVKEALGRSDLIIVTGGLGPTSDDLTRELIAQLLGKPLHPDAQILQHLENYLKERGRTLLEIMKVQAQVPEGAIVLENQLGTAPGLAMEIRPNSFRPNGEPSWLILLPGPPRELRPMFTNLVMPLLNKHLPLQTEFASITLRTTGVPESMVEQKVAAPLGELGAPRLEIGYCAHAGFVDLRLSARGDGARKLVADAESIARAKLGSHVYGTQDEELNAVVVRLLTERKETLAVAESCTGGLLANRITDVPGASAVFLGGIVSYSNAAKEKFLGVNSATLASHSAVSKQVATEMAEGARAKFGSDYALATTGIAGPSGGSVEKPVGTVFIALASARKTIVLNPLNRFDRATFKLMTTQQALELLRRMLLD